MGASFGSRPARARAEVERLAREENLPSEPVYSAKLFMVARQEARPGAVIVHSGLDPTGAGSGLTE